MHLEKTDIIFNTFEDWVNTAQYVLDDRSSAIKASDYDIENLEILDYE